MKKIVMLLGICLSLLSKEIIVFENEYNMLLLEKKVNKIVIGSRDVVGVSILDEDNPSTTLLKLFGKKRGSTSLLVVYEDKKIENYRIYVNENLSHIQKMVNFIEPNIFISRVGNDSTVISGEFNSPRQKKRIYALLEKAGINIEKVMDISKINRVSKMVRTKLYLVEISNQTAEDLGGVTGLGFFSKYTDIVSNANAATSVTFSGFLLDNMGKFSTQTGNSVVGTLNFLQEKGIAKILDDTVLLTTEDKNASFRVGGEVYIPVGVRDNGTGLPTIELEEKKYGLSLTLKTFFMEKEDFMHINVDIEDSAFDYTASHSVQLGEFTTVPSFISKNIKTDVIAKSGQTIALGGRLHKENFEEEEKVPLLGDIPLLGELFKRNVSGEKNNDILFFLVPEIVDVNTDMDESDYYREFKKSGIGLHEKINKTDDKIKATTNKELLQKSEKSNLHVGEDLAEVTKAKHTEQSTLHVEESPSQGAELNQDKRGLHVEEALAQTEDNAQSSLHVEEALAKSVELSYEQQSNTHNQEALSQSEELSQDKSSIDAEESLAQGAEVSGDVVEDRGSALLEKLKVEEISIEHSSQESFADEKLYEVAVGKIFLRENPLEGKRVLVWKEGHKFNISERQNLGESTWLKVKNDCFDECLEVEQELWISEKYTREL